jgi:proteasome assembly chaperone (PAC2) family protein
LRKRHVEPPYSGFVLDVESWPELRDPVLVIALSGWVDAGFAGASAAAMLREQMGAARVFARIDLSDLVDLQQTRPTVHIVEGATRRISWPVIECVAGRAGRDVVLCTGPEPSLRWPSIVAEIVTMAKRLDVRAVYGLGALPAVSTHRRPVPVLATATGAELANEVGALRTDYSGATGLQTTLLVALGEAGLPGVGLWAQVPHYVAGNASPPATHAVLARLCELTGVVMDLDDLARQSVEYVERVESGLADRPDVAELVQAIEAEHPELPSADELASEIERFLRSRPDQD